LFSWHQADESKMQIDEPTEHSDGNTPLESVRSSFTSCNLKLRKRKAVVKKEEEESSDNESGDDDGDFEVTVLVPSNFPGTEEIKKEGEAASKEEEGQKRVRFRWETCLPCENAFMR
jgi:hypothetical protein